MVSFFDHITRACSRASMFFTKLILWNYITNMTFFLIDSGVTGHPFSLVLHVSILTEIHRHSRELINFIAQATGLFVFRSALLWLMIFCLFVIVKLLLFCFAMPTQPHMWVPVGVALSHSGPTICTMKAPHRPVFISSPALCKIKHLNRHCHTLFIPCPRKSHQSLKIAVTDWRSGIEGVHNHFYWISRLSMKASLRICFVCWRSSEVNFQPHLTMILPCHRKENKNKNADGHRITCTTTLSAWSPN